MSETNIEARRARTQSISSMRPDRLKQTHPLPGRGLSVIRPELIAQRTPESRQIEHRKGSRRVGKLQTASSMHNVTHWALLQFVLKHCSPPKICKPSGRAAMVSPGRQRERTAHPDAVLGVQHEAHVRTGRRAVGGALQQNGHRTPHEIECTLQALRDA